VKCSIALNTRGLERVLGDSLCKECANLRTKPTPTGQWITEDEISDNYQFVEKPDLSKVASQEVDGQKKYAKRDIQQIWYQTQKNRDKEIIKRFEEARIRPIREMSLYKSIRKYFGTHFDVSLEDLKSFTPFQDWIEGHSRFKKPEAVVKMKAKAFILHLEQLSEEKLLDTPLIPKKKPKQEQNTNQGMQRQE
jgi:hypothetical protein